MGVGGYKIRNKSAEHFVTFAVVDWVDVFTRPVFKDIVVDSLRHCQTEKGLWLHAWCLMTNHLHMVLSSKENDPSSILRDFKRHTSKKVLDAIFSNPKESRKEWMMDIFSRHGQSNSRNSEYQFWQQDNHPKELFSPEFTAQRSTIFIKILWWLVLLINLKNICTVAPGIITMERSVDCWK